MNFLKALPTLPAALFAGKPTAAHWVWLAILGVGGLALQWVCR